MELIKKAAELEIPTTVKMMLYGQAGMGKTTLALSAPKPLLLDFDGGVKRVNLSHLDTVATVQVEKWQDVLDVIQENLNEYQTIVVDTIGKMMDFIISFKVGTRQPQIRDWSGINAEFQNFVRAINSLNKNIIFVAHRDTRKEGDDTVFIPALREKNYNTIVTELDLLGYVEMKSENGQQRRTITFDPTSRNDGKNTCNLPGLMVIPTTVDAKGNATGDNDFIQTSIIAPYVEMLAKKQEEHENYKMALDVINTRLEGVTDAKTANEFKASILDKDAFKHIGASLAYARKIFSNRVKELSLNWDGSAYADAVVEPAQ